MKELLVNFQSNKKLNPDYKIMVTDLLNSGIDDEGRLWFILECVEKNKPLYKTDMKFLESMTDQLEHKIRELQGNTVRTTKPKENHSRTLISDKHLDKIIDRQNTKTTKIFTPVRKKRSFLVRLFSR